MSHVKIVAWAGWQGWDNSTALSIYEQVNRPRHTRGESEIDIEFVTYVGGGKFSEKVEQGASIVIGDREILAAYALDGRLHALPSTPEEQSAILSAYPSWLASWTLKRNRGIVALPIRWGMTAFLAHRRFLRRISKGGADPTAAEMIQNAQRILLWIPDGYFLPSMGILASAINPKSPFTLDDEQVELFAELLMDGLAQREVLATSTVLDFAKKLVEMEPDLVPCAGDWILNSMMEPQVADQIPGVREKIYADYVYLFAVDAKPLLFFEMAGILSDSGDHHASRAVLNVISSPEFRREVEKLDVGENGYIANPTWAGAKVLGPGSVDGPSFTERPAEEIVSKGAPRWLPRDRFLRPRILEWRELFEQFREEAGFSE